MSLAPAGGGGGDIVWGAYIEDHTGSFWQQQAQYFTQFNIQINQFQQNFVNSFNRFGAATGSAVTGVRGVIHTVSQLAHVISHVFGPAIRAVEDFAQESIDLAANTNMLGTVLEFVGGNAGYSAEELEQMTDTMNEQGITIRGSRQILLEMIQTNLDLATATELAARAQDVGRATMVNSTEAAQRMIHAIATLNPLVLRRMGIIVDFEQAYRDYASSIDVAWESLSTEQKQLVATQEVLRATAPLIGAYGASLEEVGGQVLSLDRLMEDFKVTLGQVFQPAYTTLVENYSKALQDGRDALEESKEGTDALGNRIQGLLNVLLSLGKVLVDLGAQLLSFVKLPLDAINTLLGIDFSPLRTEVNATTSLFTEFSVFIVQSAVGIIATVANAVEVVNKGIIATAATAREAIISISKGQFGRLLDLGFYEQIQEVQDMRSALLTFRDDVNEVMTEAGMSTRQLITGVADVGDETSNTAQRIDSEMSRIQAAIREAVQAIEEFNEAIAEDFAKRALQIERENFEEQIRLFRQLADAQRGYFRRLEDIRRQFGRRREDLMEDLAEDEKDLAKKQNDDRIDLEEEFAEKRLEIEREYIRELEDIQRHYVEDVQEAARQNDAVAVARLMRQRARDRRDARIERDRDIEDLERDYQKELDDLEEFQEERRKKIRDDAAKRLADLQETLNEQLEDAALARQRELDDLELYNKRRQDDIARQRTWELEDLKAKHKDEIEELAQHLSEIEELDQATLNKLIDQHADFYADDIKDLVDYYDEKERIAREHQYALSNIYTSEINRYQQYRPEEFVAPWQSEVQRYSQYNVLQPTITRPPTQPVVPEPAPAPKPFIAPSSGIPPHILERCRQNPNDPICGWYGLQHGGLFITEKPTRFMSSEFGQPEMIAAIPLTGSMDHNIRVSGRMGVDGVSPGMERDMSGEILSMLRQIGEQLVAGA